MKTLLFILLFAQQPDTAYINFHNNEFILKYTPGTPGVIYQNDTAYYDNVFLYNNVDTIYLKKVE